ncbi:response regulator [Desulfobotulus sp. H1]|uniref:histidine kinase n=1 Tax=Desulfobotulus pelophilus TaxID=2823377 RepID=A0ABT3N959_9BACT|nr:response regulator [Desulfobotulus pelophilus]MCW7753997.1 response regulator [Desulfobotulus pelophilus]
MKSLSGRSSQDIWSVDWKTTVSFMSMVCIVLCVGVAGYAAVFLLHESLYNLGNNRIPDLKALAVLNQHRMSIRGDTFAVGLLENMSEPKEAYVTIRDSQQHAWKNMDEAWSALRSSPRQSEKGRELMKQAEADYRAWRNVHTHMDRVLQQLVEYKDLDHKNGLHRQYRELTAEVLPLSCSLSLTLDALTDNNIVNIRVMADHSLSIARILRKGAVFSILLATGLALFLFWMSHRARKEVVKRQWHAHRTLERRRANLQAIFDTAPVGMLLINDSGEVCQINPVISAITGSSGMFRQVGDFLQCVHALPPEQGCGNKNHGPCSQCRIRASFECALSTGREVRGVESAHVLVVHGRTRNFFFQVSAASLVLAERHHVLISLFDITAHKEAEAELRSSNVMLEKTMAHAEVMARKADEANRSKSTFLANMSHEIRTPMNAIMGLTDLCLRTDLFPVQRNYVDRIQDAAQSLMGLLNDILDISKMEAGELRLETIPFNLDDVLEKLRSLFAGAAKQKGVELLFWRHVDTPCNLMGDPLRLGQVLTNLVSNAIKFTKMGEVLIRIECPWRSPHSATLLFVVRDTGVGMSDEQAAHIFEPFSQADASITRTYGGTGLGLSIVRQLVQLMGGQIRLETLNGEGSSFVITCEFPVQKGEGVALCPPLYLQGLKVLVADDNPTARSIFRQYLEALRFEVQVADSGEEVLSILYGRMNPFHLIILDYRMPGLNGLETAEKIMESLSDESPAPLIFLSSAFVGQEILTHAMDKGVAAFIEKPVTPSYLLDVFLENIGPEEKSRFFSRRRSGYKTENYTFLKGFRILLVDDNEVNRFVAGELLGQSGVLVDLAENGRQAVDIIAAHPPDYYFCVLMDVQMPVLDGYEATRIIRKDPKFRFLPILALTANAMMDDREMAMKAGMNDYIVKPIQPGDLFSCLSRWLPSASRASFRTEGQGF